MGARQSVAQPPRHRAPTSNADLGTGPSTSGNSNGAATSSHYTNGHTLGEPSTSAADGSSGGGSRNRSSLIFQSSMATASTSQQQQPRPRQTRSRSVPMPPPDVVRATHSGASTSTNQSGQQQLPQQFRFHHYPALLRDQSSDSSGGDNDGALMSGLERYLRLTAGVATGGHASTSGTGSNAAAVWLPLSTSRHYGK